MPTNAASFSVCTKLIYHMFVLGSKIGSWGGVPIT
jgi:hypothetical protein